MNLKTIKLPRAARWLLMEEFVTIEAAPRAVRKKTPNDLAQISLYVVGHIVLVLGGVCVCAIRGGARLLLPRDDHGGILLPLLLLLLGKRVDGKGRKTPTVHRLAAQPNRAKPCQMAFTFPFDGLDK